MASVEVLTRVLAFFRFLYDGERIAEDDTPEKLDMEENGESLQFDYQTRIRHTGPRPTTRF